MTIIERNGKSRRFAGWETLAGSALVAAAVFSASPKQAKAQVDFNTTGGTTTDPNSSQAATWFNTKNWSYVNITGTLPESFGPSAGTPAVIACAPNTVMPSVGIVFDPKDDPNTPGGPNANYVANISGLSGNFYIAGVTSNGTEPATPNKLTVESGTIVTVTATVGRDAAGILALNGGTFITSSKFLVQGVTVGRTFLGTGTFEYHGGTLAAAQEIRVGGQGATGGASLTSAGLGYFVVYNDGVDGAMLAGNGFEVGSSSIGMGTIGIVEFHYDKNTGGIGGTRPIQANWNSSAGPQQLPGILQLGNTSNESSRLNLVLDTAPTVTNGVVQNLGLFDETLVQGVGTFPAAFYSVDGLTVFTQGATISAAYANKTYSWTISYSGQINFTNTATSAYSPTEIQATGGDDVVLIGIPVPEPGSLAALGGIGAMMLARRRRRNGAKR
jgi:hypothetical protein